MSSAQVGRSKEAVAGAAPPTTGSVVDGFPLGTALQPAPDADVAALGVAALNEAVPGHPSVVSATAYHEDLALLYGTGVHRSGTVTIYVYALADGTYHAAGVYCGPAGCQPWPVYRP